MNQKTAAYNAIKSIVTFTDGDTVTLTKEQTVKIKAILVKGFNDGDIELKATQEDMGKYVNGLISNWLRKDKRMNGNITYKAKNPGSRRGQSDSQVKNLRLLKKTLEEKEDQDVDAIADVEVAIKTRLNEIKPTKTIEVDAEAIPEHLQHLVPTA